MSGEFWFGIFGVLAIWALFTIIALLLVPFAMVLFGRYWKWVEKFLTRQ